MFVIITNSSWTGFCGVDEVLGPFDCREDAIAYGERHLSDSDAPEWAVMPVQEV